MSLSKQLNKLVVIQYPMSGKDAAGGNVTNWLNLHAEEQWAGIRNMPGTEKRGTSHGGQVAVARTEIALWFDPAITEVMRIVYGGKFYNIRHVNNYNEQDQVLILTCDTGTAVTG